MRIIKVTIAGAFGAFLVGCSPVVDPDNLELPEIGEAYQAQYRDPGPIKRGTPAFLLSARMNADQCQPYRGGAAGKGRGAGLSAPTGELLSRGDLLDVRVADDDTFTGAYEVSRDGTIRMPYLAPIAAQGRSVAAVEADLISVLRRDGFYVEAPRVSVRVKDFASAAVGVTGAVFEPRPVEIGSVQGDRLDRTRQEALGASTEGRDIANALRAAGGVRPDADLSAVELRRAGRVYRLDLRGVIEGRDHGDVMLLTGDEIFVPSRMCFQDALLKPGPISPPGISLFLSNLTQPGTGNASSAIGRDVREVPYGTRFMQAVIDANCAGGARATSGRRAAALFSRNPVTGVSLVIERDVEGMLRRSDRDDYDPYVLPGDSVICYDSAVTNLTEIGKAIGILAIGLAP